MKNIWLLLRNAEMFFGREVYYKEAMVCAMEYQAMHMDSFVFIT